MTNSNHHRETLAEYKAMMEQVDQEARDRLAKELQTKDNATQTKKVKPDAEEE